jgi:hypothetical protein
MLEANPQDVDQVAMLLKKIRHWRMGNFLQASLTFNCKAMSLPLRNNYVGMPLRSHDTHDNNRNVLEQ